MKLYILVIILISCVPPGYRYKNNAYNYSYSNDVEAKNFNKYNNKFIYTSVYNKNVYNNLTVSQVEFTGKVENQYNKNNLSISKNFKYYKIKKGETLFRIAKQNNVSLKYLCKINNIKNPEKIKAGMLLKIPLNNKLSITNINTKKNRYVEKSNISFKWPVRYVVKYKRDGDKHIKAIGLYIESIPGEKVVASASGRVVEIGYMRGFGNFVVLQHDGGFYTIYSNLLNINIKNGAYLKKGDVIGRIPYNEPLLHFQINKSGKPLNPLEYLSKI